MLKGAIFDWDGVVIDSSCQHEKSWEALAREEGQEFSKEIFKKSFGCKNDAIIPKYLCWTEDKGEIERISRRKEELYREILKLDGLEGLPGVRELLDEFKEAGVRCAIGSSTERANIDLSLELLGLGEYFSVIVSADDVTVGKPDPQVFLKAAEGLGYAPENCVVLEDAPVGIQAGVAAGMTVIGVGTTHDVTQLKEAHLVVGKLTEINLSEIESKVTALISA